MGHLRETFPVIEDLATGEGQSLHTAIAGQTAAGKNGLSAFSFKDSSGNFVHPMLTSEGKVPVDFAGAGVPKSASSEGEIAGSTSLTLIAEVNLTVSKTYGKMYASISCFRETVAYLIQTDDVTETILGAVIVGPGNYSGVIDLGVTEIVAGASGDQKLSLKAKNTDKLSDFLGHVACLEFAA